VTSFALARCYAALAGLCVVLGVAWPLDGYGWTVTVAYLCVAAVALWVSRREVRGVRRRRSRARAVRAAAYRNTDWTGWTAYGVARFGGTPVDYSEIAPGIFKRYAESATEAP
jgi:hypothetical protein